MTPLEKWWLYATLPFCIFADVLARSLAESPGIYLVLQLIIASLLVVSLAVQYRYIYGVLKRYGLVWAHLILLAGGFLLPALAMLLGDVQGAAAYNDAPDSNLTNILTIALLSLGTVSIPIFIGNMIYIPTKGRHKVLNVFGWIGYGIVAFLLAAVSFFIYGITYSLHDPSTE